MNTLSEHKLQAPLTTVLVDAAPSVPEDHRPLLARQRRSRVGGPIRRPSGRTYPRAVELLRREFTYLLEKHDDTPPIKLYRPRVPQDCSAQELEELDARHGEGDAFWFLLARENPQQREDREDQGERAFTREELLPQVSESPQDLFLIRKFLAGHTRSHGCSLLVSRMVTAVYSVRRDRCGIVWIAHPVEQ